MRSRTRASGRPAYAVALPSCRCTCGAKLEGATAARGPACTPSPGDFSVCLYCARIHRFNDDLTLREATGVDLAELDEDERRTLTTVMRAVHQTRPS